MTTYEEFIPKGPPGKKKKISDEQMSAEKLAEAHVDLFLETVRPLMITEFLHGYKHGLEDR